MYYVFAKKGCGACQNVINILDKKGVNYKKIDINTPAGLQKAQDLNITHAGTIIDENNKVIPLKDVK